MSIYLGLGRYDKGQNQVLLAQNSYLQNAKSLFVSIYLGLGRYDKDQNQVLLAQTSYLQNSKSLFVSVYLSLGRCDKDQIQIPLAQTEINQIKLTYIIIGISILQDFRPHFVTLWYG